MGWVTLSRRVHVVPSSLVPLGGGIASLATARGSALVGASGLVIDCARGDDDDPTTEATMTIVQATVTKLATDDGFIEFEPHVAIGHTYLVDVCSIRRAQPMVKQLPDGTFVEHAKDIVYLATGEAGWLPLDLLKLEA
jgi:hypothetical protein